MVIEEYTSLEQELSTSNTEPDNPEHAEPCQLIFYINHFFIHLWEGG